MNEKGRAVYEAIRIAWYNGAVGWPSIPWESLSEEEQAEWQRIAQTATWTPVNESEDVW